MKNPKFVIALFSVDGQYQGYLKSVSIYHQKVLSANNIGEAKSYAKVETATKDGELVAVLTHGGLLYKVANI